MTSFFRFRLDENVDALFARYLLNREPALVVWPVGLPSAPPKGTPDPNLLLWCEEYGFILVTNNRKSMPVHLGDHLNAGRHIPGIILLNPTLSDVENTDELWLIATSGDLNRFQDRISYLPI